MLFSAILRRMALRAYASRRFFIALTAASLLFVCARQAQATVYYVSTSGSDSNSGLSWSLPLADIPSALGLASSGDQIWVQTGTYMVNLTTVDGVSLYGGFAGTETSLSQRNVTANPTILDGNQSGSVVAVPSSSTGTVTTDGFTIQNGSAYKGGGIVDNATDILIINNCTFTNDSASYGGGALVGSSNVTISDCTFTNNNATSGGGIWIGSPIATVVNCTFTSNTASYGGGASVFAGVITGCTFTGNSSSINGGGVYEGVTGAVSASELIGNTPNELYLQGIGTASAPFLINDNLIVGTGTSGPDGVDVDTASGASGDTSYLTIANNTIVNTNIGINISSASGSFGVANNILDGNGGGLNDTGTIPFTSSHNDVYGNVAYGYQGVSPSSSDLTVDPIFVNASAGGYRLAPGSPCIDAGDDGYVNFGDTDLDGQPRIVGIHVDVGAYEFTTTPVVTNLNDSGPGSFRTAISIANDAPGSTIAFQSGLSGTITLAGALPTITASATVQGPGASTLTIDGAGLYRVFTIDAPNDTVSISGLTIQHGSDQIDGQGGGGVYMADSSNDSATVNLSGCIFTGNSANNGGGISDQSQDDLVIGNCTITGNSAVYGGGIYASSPTCSVTSCTFAGNSATVGGGGGLFISGQTSSVTNCTFTDDSANDAGGGIFTISPTCLITNCTFTGDSVPNDNGSGACVGDGSNATISNCTFTGNSGSAIDNLGAIDLQNCILYGDTGGEISNQATLTAMNCDIQGGFSGTGNFDANPLLASLGNYGGPTEAFALLPGSPCLGAGAAVSGVTTDQRGVAVPQNGRYDIGAFESRGFTVTATGGSGQSALINTRFATPLTLTVTANASIEPVGHGQVFFRTPTSGASAAVSASPAPLTASGTASVTATANAVPGSYGVKADTRAGYANFNLTNTAPVAQITSLSPSSAAVGSPAFTLTVTGTEFISGAVVVWNGTGLSTTYGSSTTITAQVPAADVAVAGTISVTVVNPTAVPSNTLLFSVVHTPVTVTVSPPSISLAENGMQTFMATVKDASGATFTPTSLTWGVSGGGTINTATGAFTSGTTPGSYTVTATAIANGVTKAGTAAVRVVAPPTVTLTLGTVTGTTAGFSATAVSGDGTNLTYSWSVSPTAAFAGAATGSAASGAAFTNTLTVSAGGTYTVTVKVTDIYHQFMTATKSVTFTVQPTITSVSPTSATVGTTVTITGTHLTGATSVTVGGVSVHFTVVNGTTITFVIPPGLAGGTIVVTTPGGTVSSTVSLVVLTWAAVGIGVSGDGTSRLLWTRSDGAAGLWILNAAGAVTAVGPTYGPYPGWTARAIATAPDGTSRVLWTNANGQAGVWAFNAAGTETTVGSAYGPYPGWTAKAVGVAGDGTARVLWTNTNGQAGLWIFNASCVKTTIGTTYGPYSDANGSWSAKGIATDANGLSKVLWTSTFGDAGVWTFNAAGTETVIGPSIPPSGNLSGLTATAIGAASTFQVVVNPVNGQTDTSTILWTNAGGQAKLLTLDASDGNDSNRVYGSLYGPYSGWVPTTLGLYPPDGTARVLWKRSDRAAGTWSFDTNDNQAIVGTTYGPY